MVGNRGCGERKDSHTQCGERGKETDRSVTQTEIDSNLFEYR